jgi:hypothetical protein
MTEYVHVVLTSLIDGLANATPHPLPVTTGYGLTGISSQFAITFSLIGTILHTLPITTGYVICHQFAVTFSLIDLSPSACPLSMWPSRSLS